MTEASIRQFLDTEVIGREIRVLAQATSTNDVAMQLGREGCADGLAVFAAEQTQGRGRLGRSWSFQEGKSLALSIVLRPGFAETSRLSLVAAVAVARALEGFSNVAVGIKWPNDLWLAGKKVAGILCEKSGDLVIVGIGVNVLQAREDFPEDLAARATSLALQAETRPDLSQVAAAILREMDVLYRSLPEGFPEVIAECERRSALFQEEVRIERGTEVITGKVAGLDESGALRILLPSGGETLITAGEVTLLTRRAA